MVAITGSRPDRGVDLLWPGLLAGEHCEHQRRSLLGGDESGLLQLLLLPEREHSPKTIHRKNYRYKYMTYVKYVDSFTVGICA